MAGVPFYTLALARKLEAAGFPSQQAQAAAAALAEVLSDRVVTKADLRDLEQRLTIKLGGMMAVSIAAAAALVKLP